MYLICGGHMVVSRKLVGWSVPLKENCGAILDTLTRIIIQVRKEGRDGSLPGLE